MHTSLEPNAKTATRKWFAAELYAAIYGNLSTWISQFGAAWIFLPVLLACAVCLCFVPHVGIMPGSDYWGVLGQLVGNHGLHITASGLYAQDNEHIIAVPKLIYALNVLLTHGSNEALTVIACGMSLLIGLMLASALHRALVTQTAHRSVLLLLVLGVMAGAAAFSPLASHNFFEGMSGVAWVCTNMLVVAAFYLQYRHPNSYKVLAASIVLTLLAAHSYSTGVPALILLGLQLAFQHGSRRRGLTVGTLGAVLLATVYFLQTVPTANGEHMFSLPLLGAFEALFIGAGITTHPELAFVWGAAGLVLFAWLTVTSFWQRRSLLPAQAFWVTLGGYAITAGLMAGIGRISVFGLGDAIASRYATLPALFWIALAGLLLTAEESISRDSFKARARALALVGCAAVATLLASSHHGLAAAFARSVYRPGATLSVFVGANDMKLIHDTITPAPNQLTRIRSKLQSMGHVPFNGYYDRCPKLGSHLPVNSTSRPAKGYIDSGKRLGEGAYVKLHGWAARNDGSSYARLVGKPQCIAIANAAGRVEGLGIAGLPRPDVAAFLHSRDSGFGWVGYARSTTDSAKLVAYAYQPEGKWAPLGKAAHLRNGAISVY